MGALTPTLTKVETEGDLQVVNLKFASITNNDTYDVSGFFKQIVSLSVFASGAASDVTGSESAGVITFLVGSGTPSAFVRIAGN